MLFGIGLGPSARAWSAPSDTVILTVQLKRRAIVIETIQPGDRGRVSYQGTSWFAVCPYQVVLPPGTPVTVIEQYSATTVIVEPVATVNFESVCSTQLI